MLGLIMGGSITQHLEYAKQSIECGFSGAKPSKGGAQYHQDGQGRAAEPQLSKH